MKQVPFYDITVTDGFWEQMQTLNVETTLWAVYDRFCETGRVRTMDCKAGEIQPHCYWGSDVFKWLEGASYILEKNDNPQLLQAVEHIVDMVEGACREDGYYNSYYNNPGVTEKPFSDRIMHELYSLGHMIEAAVAHYHATGSERLLDLAKRGADLVYRIFLQEDSAAFATPGHEEIELALLRLYQYTGEEKYFRLAEFFLKKRGNNEKDTPVMDDDKTVDQSHLPVYEQEEAVGHAVRAVYLYSAMADYAEICGDEKMQAAAEKLFTDIYERKMYITGGIGSFRYGERFMVPYQLPNETAYAETCAALGFALFCRRMYCQKLDGRYGDGAERALFNGMISGLSLSGDAFFYKNPLEINLAHQPFTAAGLPETQRKKVFDCSCCPPNLVRLIASVADFIYSYDKEHLYVHQYIGNEGIVDGKGVSIETKYPAEGRVSVCYEGDKKLVLRRPGWCQKIVTNEAYREEQGYLYFETTVLTLNLLWSRSFIVRIRRCQRMWAV